MQNLGQNLGQSSELSVGVTLEADMTKVPKKGEHVTWKAAQGETDGTVEKVVTTTTKIKGHVAKATKEDPQVVVKSARSGKQAVHKPDQLKKT